MAIRRAPQRDWFLYQTERYHYETFGYDIAIPKGNAEYVIVLKFCEVYFASINQKVFDVKLNGHTVLSQFDIFAASGGRGVALDRAISFTIVDDSIMIDNVRLKFTGTLSVTFVKSDYDNPKINAFYVIRATSNDIPMLLAANQRDYHDDDDDDIIDDVDDELHLDSSYQHRDDDNDHTRRQRLASGPAGMTVCFDVDTNCLISAPNPYGDTDAMQLIIPVLVTITCFLPLLYCMCTLLR